MPQESRPLSLSLSLPWGGDSYHLVKDSCTSVFYQLRPHNHVERERERQGQREREKERQRERDRYSAIHIPLIGLGIAIVEP